VACMYCSNYVEYWLIALAVWSCGGCIVPANCESDSETMTEILLSCNAKMLICDDFNVDDALEVQGNVDSLQHVVVIGDEGKGEGCIPVRYEHDEIFSL